MEKARLLVLVLICFLVGGIGVWYLHGTSSPASQSAIAADSLLGDTSSSSDVPPPLATSTPVTPEATQGMRQYQNSAFHFSLLFPDNLQATEYKEAGGALTATFQDPSTNEGFEVYVTPYNGAQITENRFKLDEPSGVRNQPTDVVIDGVRATMFFGNNGTMGDTREVWFIHGGFLYEVTTYKELDTWLGQIMQTWKFI